MEDPRLKEQGYEFIGWMPGNELPGDIQETIETTKPERRKEIRAVRSRSPAEGIYFSYYLLGKDKPEVSLEGFIDAEVLVNRPKKIGPFIANILRLETYPTPIEEIPEEFRLIRPGTKDEYKVYIKD